MAPHFALIALASWLPLPFNDSTMLDVDVITGFARNRLYLYCLLVRVTYPTTAVCFCTSALQLLFLSNAESFVKYGLRQHLLS